MKLSRFSIAILFLFGLTLVSCSKDDNKDEPTPAPSQTGTMKATVGSNAFSSNDASARFRSTGEFTIKATTSDGKSLFFVLNGFSGAIDYTFAPTLANKASYSYQFNGSTQHFSTDDGGSGLLSVTDYNESEQVISGTFSLVILQEGNVGNSLQITEGSFTNVPIKKLEKPAAGSISYYADDSYFPSATPDLVISPLFKIQFPLDAPNGDFDVLLYSNAPPFSVDMAVIATIPIYNTDVEISDYELADGKLSVKLKVLEDRDFEIWINEYPVSQPYQAEDTGILYFYTDTADFISTEITLVGYSTNVTALYLSLKTQNSNGSEMLTSFFDNSPYSGLSMTLPSGDITSVGGESRVIFNESETAASHLGFVAEDSSLVIVGRNIPL